MFETGTACPMPSKGIRVAARDLRPGDVLVKEGWSVLAVERPMTDHATIRVTLVKRTSSRPFQRELSADEVKRVDRGGPRSCADVRARN